MAEVYAHVHVPNAKRMGKRTSPNDDVRALVNVIKVRFALFAVSSLVLFALVARAAMQVL